MAEFERAIDVVLAHEGGFVDNPADPGGATNHGISLRYALAELNHDSDGDGHLDGDLDHDGDIDRDDIAKMTVGDATAIYRRQWWDRYGYGRINDQRVATKVFDAAVNMGPGTAHRLAQRAAANCGRFLVIDGELGPISIAALNASMPEEWLVEMAKEMRDFYRGLIVKNPKLGAFRAGWFKRAAWPLEMTWA